MAGTLSTATPGALAPFRHREFALLWSAGLVSNIGTWMNQTATGWLMTELAPSPLMVAAVQSASSLPVFLFAILAGALADLLDRRRFLLTVKAILTGVSALLAVLVGTGAMSPPLLLLFTFLMGTGAAFLAPAWQSIIPSLVPRSVLPQAVALNSTSLNVARAIGPATAGILIAGAGITVPFLLDTVSFLVVIAALLVWRPPPRPAPALPRESVPEAIVTGLRFAAASPELRATLARATLFFAGGSAFWALLPLVTRQSLSGGPSLYGLLLGAVGTGAVAGALLLPALRRTFSSDRLLAAASLGVGLATLSAAWGGGLWLVLAGALLMGLSWIVALTSLNLSAQLALPEWARGRGLSIFTTVFFGAMTLGSLGWGGLAAAVGLSVALAAAALLSACGSVLGGRWRLVHTDDPPDLSPSAHWPQPLVSGAPALDRGPVMVTVSYRVPAERMPEFLVAISALAQARRRGGASLWGLVEDVARPGELMEWFVEESWLAHLRHHERVTVSDRKLQEAVLALHAGPEPPRVTHWLAPDPHLPSARPPDADHLG